MNTRSATWLVLGLLMMAGCDYPSVPTGALVAPSPSTKPNGSPSPSLRVIGSPAPSPSWVPSPSPTPASPYPAPSPSPGASLAPSPSPSPSPSQAPSVAPSVEPTRSPDPGSVAVQVGGAVAGVWRPVAPASRPRVGPGAAELGGLFALVAGDGQEILELYNPTTGRWTVMDFAEAIPASLRYQFGPYFPVAGTVGGDRLVVAGGTAGSPLGLATRVYHVVSATVRLEMGPSMATPRYVACGAVIGRQLFVAGGLTPDGAWCRELEAYDPVAGTWSNQAAMPVAVAGAAAVELAGKLVVMGGYEASGQPSTLVQVYHPEAGSWSTTEMAALPKGRHSAAAAVAGGSLYLLGGKVDDQVTASVLRYDAAANKWVDAPPLLTPRMLHAAATVGGGIYLGGGQDRSGAPLRTVEEFEP